MSVGTSHTNSNSGRAGSRNVTVRTSADFSS